MNLTSANPMISCICVTCNRPKQLLNAIVDFDQQDYPNKELIISYPNTDTETKHLIEKILKLSPLKIVQLERDQKESLGAAKNQAIMKSNGEYICIWDDDDCHHHNRLTHQINPLLAQNENYNASILTRILLYDQPTQSAYYSFTYNWSGSLLCSKEAIIQNQYLKINQLEDINLIQYLESENRLYHIDDIAFLYIYVNHGKNSLNPIYFKYFTKKSPMLHDEAIIQSIRKRAEQSIELSES